MSQLNTAGLDRQGVHYRAKTGRLHPIHRGVYAVGHVRLTFEGRCLAGALAIGDGAVVSHRSAAAIWDMLPPHSGPIHITLAGDGGRRRRDGIAIHRSLSLFAGSVTRRHSVPITKPARTLRDLCRTAPASVYRRAVRRALDMHLIRSGDLEREPDLTRSELERLFLRLCRRHRLPQPEVNARLGPYEVDFLWRPQRLVVETDGFRHHGDRVAFESDRTRDARLQSRGYRVLRLTYRQVKERPEEVAAALRALVGQGRLAPNL